MNSDANMNTNNGGTPESVVHRGLPVTIINIIATGIMLTSFFFYALILHWSVDNKQEQKNIPNSISVQRNETPPPPPPSSSTIQEQQKINEAVLALEIPQVQLPAMNQSLVMPIATPQAQQFTNWKPKAPSIPNQIFSQKPNPVPVISNNQPPRRLFTPDLSAFYPPRARQRRIEGKSVVHLRINSNGDVIDVKILHSEPNGVFDNAAKKAAKRLRYDFMSFDPQHQNNHKNEEKIYTHEETFIWSLQ